MPYYRIYSDDWRPPGTPFSDSAGSDSFEYIAGLATETDEATAAVPFARVVNNTIHDDTHAVDTAYGGPNALDDDFAGAGGAEGFDFL